MQNALEHGGLTVMDNAAEADDVFDGVLAMCKQAITRTRRDLAGAKNKLKMQ